MTGLALGQGRVLEGVRFSSVILPTPLGSIGKGGTRPMGAMKFEVGKRVACP